MTASLPWQIGVVLLTAALQQSRLNHLPATGWYLGWLLVLVVCWSMLFGRWSGVLCGLLAGALQDLLGGPPYSHWLCYALVGYLAGHTNLLLLRHNYVLVVVAVVAATGLSELVQAAILSLQQQAWAWPEFLDIIPLLALGNALAALPVFLLLQGLVRFIWVSDSR